VGHTKIIATVGPASDTEATLDALIAAGTDIFRLNFSHGTHESHAATYRRIREASKRACCEVAVLQDRGGRKLRTVRLAGGKAIVLAPGESVTNTTGDGVGGPGRLFTTFEGLAKCVRTGDRLLLADVRGEPRVESTDGREIQATVVEGGEIGEHKGINAPGVPLPTSAVTPKDCEDLKFGLSLGVDMVALSFVQTAADLKDARAIMSAANAGDVPLIAMRRRLLDSVTALDRGITPPGVDPGAQQQARPGNVILPVGAPFADGVDKLAEGIIAAPWLPREYANTRS